ncbi:23259_t:CDS:2, partial [Gigaspora rosea]
MTVDILQDTQVTITSPSPSSSHPGVALNGGVSSLSPSSSQSGVTLNSTSRVSSSPQPEVTLNSTCGVPYRTPLSTTISNGPTITDITYSTTPSDKNGITYSTTPSDKNGITYSTTPSDKNGITYSTTPIDKNGITYSTTPSDKNGITGNDTSPLPYVDPMIPPVSIIITSPTPIKSLMLKIGTNITFAWKYSSNFSIPPKYINVLAQPFINLEQYFIVVANASGNITSVIWNTGIDSLPVTKYKLYIFDERGKDAGALPGRLLSYAGFTFSLFQPKDRVDIS